MSGSIYRELISNEFKTYFNDMIFIRVYKWKNIFQNLFLTLNFTIDIDKNKNKRINITQYNKIDFSAIDIKNSKIEDIIDIDNKCLRPDFYKYIKSFDISSIVYMMWQ